jgi:hypothetical protein
MQKNIELGKTDFWTLTIQGSKPSTIQPGAVVLPHNLGDF